MGIFPTSYSPFPTSYSPKYMMYITDDNLRQAVLANHYDRIIAMDIIRRIDCLRAIDEWIGQNAKGKCYYYQDFLKEKDDWIRYYIFSEDEDATAFKLRWL